MHGSTYEKAETVAVSTTLQGRVTAVSVDEWIKNPKGLGVIEDESTLQQITPKDDGPTFERKGDKVTWQANGEDVSYSGTTDQQLPFAIDYSYKLNGKRIDPSKLKNASGKLSITISYKNKSKASVKVDGKTEKVKLPYRMASLVSFDSEHARHVKVKNGTTIDQSGTTIVAGIAMPSLTETLGIDDEVELPEKVTITAQVKGFDMPSITTVATDRALSLLSDKREDADGALDGLFEKTAQVETALGKLEQGASGLSSALSKISSGQKKLSSSLPQITKGIDGLGTASGGLSKAVALSKEKSNAALTSQASALQTLATLDTSTMTLEQKTALASVVSDLQSAQQNTAIASKGLEAADTAVGTLSNGLGTIDTGLVQIQKGYQQLEGATSKVSAASATLEKAVKKMRDEISSTLDELRDTADSKLDLVEALSDEVGKQGAFCGNASDIPENFTSQQLRTTVGLGNAPKLKICLNTGKNPQMASTMRTTVMEAMLQQGIAADVETVNDADVGGGALASTIGVQMLVMPLFIMTMIGSILTSIIFWHKDALGLRKKSQLFGLVGQVLVIAAFSAVFALLAIGIDVIAGGMDLPIIQLYPFLWLADLLVMLLFVGLCDLFFPLGALVAVTVFALGLGTAMLAPEMLPQFWRDWVYPWAPQACFGQGIRQVLYFGRMTGGSIWMPLAAEGAIGGVALLLATACGAIQARNQSTA